MELTKRRFIVMVVSLAAFGFTLLLGGGRQAAAEKPFPSLTILYDNIAATEGPTPDWGFAAIIQGLEKTILFDTGTKEDIFLNNVKALDVDLGKVDVVFISHDHSDHTGGLPAFFKVKSGLPVYVRPGPTPLFKRRSRKGAATSSPSRNPCPSSPGVFSTGDLGEAIHEQAMVLRHAEGLDPRHRLRSPRDRHDDRKGQGTGEEGRLDGPGRLSSRFETPPAEVEKIVARFKELGVKRVGATHCTGAPAIEMFRKAYGPDFVELGVGRKINFINPVLFHIEWLEYEKHVGRSEHRPV